MKTPGTVYLIHFNRAYKHARHYLGYSEHLDKRLTDHLCGMGARLAEPRTGIWPVRASATISRQIRSRAMTLVMASGDSPIGRDAEW